MRNSPQQKQDVDDKKIRPAEKQAGGGGLLYSILFVDMADKSLEVVGNVIKMLAGQKEKKNPLLFIYDSFDNVFDYDKSMRSSRAKNP